MSVTFTHVVAFCAETGGIGLNGSIPWTGKMPNEMKHFQAITRAKPLVMGRKTFESLPVSFKMLGRVIFVMTTEPESFVNHLNDPFSNHSVMTVGSKEELLKECFHSDIRELFICGGGSVYAQFEPDLVYATYVNRDYLCDTFYPYAHNLALSGCEPLKVNNSEDWVAFRTTVIK